jgi:WD40 repeat protein
MPRPATILLIVAALAPPARAADEPARPVSFRAEVAPILVKKCLGCHNDQKAKGGLNMKTIALLRKGGETYKADVLVPGDVESSQLLALLGPDASPRMPYKQPPLGEAEITTLRRWVEQGAKLDGGAEPETPIASLVDLLKDLPKVAVKVPTSDPITSLAYSPDGRLLAAAHGREVLLFDAGSGKLAATLADHPGPLTAVLITPDGRTLIAAGGRPGMFGSVTFWDLASRARKREVRSHADSVLSAALSPDGKTLATCGYDRLVKLWAVADCKEKRDLKEHTDAVYAVAFSPDSKALASAGADRTVKVWDVATGRKRVTMSDATAELYAVAFAPEGETVLAGGVDRSIRAWDLHGDSATLVRTAFAHDGAVLRLLVAPDLTTLISSGEDRSVKTWALATLKPLAGLGTQADWPMAVAAGPDGSRLAVGLYDGSLALLDPHTGKSLLAVREAPKPAPPPKPQLSFNPSLNPPSPRGGVRGSKLKVTLSGNGVGRSDAVVFPEPGIEAAIVPREKPDPNALDVELTIAPDARVGTHRFGVRTPLGTPASQSFAVSAYAETNSVEPDDDPAKAPVVALPATLLGAIDRPGDVDHFRINAKPGRRLVFETTARALGSNLDGTLAILDEGGKVLAEAQAWNGGLDPLLIFEAPRDGVYTLRVVDAQFGGSGNHFYRIQGGAIPYVRSVFPLGVQAGTSAESALAMQGPNLDDIKALPLSEAASAEPGTILRVPATAPGAARPLNTKSVVVAEGPQAVEAEGNDEPAKAGPVAVPGGVSGRIGKPGDVDHFRFEAKKGRRLVAEVFGRRLGTPVDTVIEVLDANGKPVPRAVLRPVEETEVAFRDHPSTGRNVRLTQWNDFAEGDFVLVGRELMRLFELPRNPDDDAVFWGLGHPRDNTGQRVAFLGTTPEHHPQGQAIYKVEIHPPGATFPAGGVPPVTLVYRNDDGGPGIGKDSLLIFDPPADGTYVVRVEDVRGLGGEDYGYHLVVRRPRPDFQVSVSTENPNIPRRGTHVLSVNVVRKDGFEGPVDVRLDGLPPGITATSARIEPEVYTADLILMADDSAPAVSPPTWTVHARADRSGPPSEGGPGATTIEHSLDPGGPKAGWITVTGAPNLKIGFRPEKVAIRPGERVEMTLTVERNPAFKGRVPIDVRNLPRGVRVLNIGLNGVLVTEAQTERNIFLYAEPWAEPQRRPFYAVGRCEPAGTDHGSAPISLTVLPPKPGPREAASAGER